MIIMLVFTVATLSVLSASQIWMWSEHTAIVAHIMESTLPGMTKPSEIRTPAATAGSHAYIFTGCR